MSTNPNIENNKEGQIQEEKNNGKEFNFRKLESERNAAIKMAEDERTARIAAEALLQNRNQTDDDDDDEPYIDKKKLARQFSKFEATIEQKIEAKASEKARMIFEEHKKQQWLKSNPDFYDVMSHVQKFADKDAELAETILEMPDNFERQKLVYKNIKALGLHKKEEPKPSIQETIDKNKRAPYYQPSSVGAPPYGTGFDYTPQGGEAAYKKMQELKARIRI